MYKQELLSVAFMRSWYKKITIEFLRVIDHLQPCSQAFPTRAIKTTEKKQGRPGNDHFILSPPQDLYLQVHVILLMLI